jgi:predicted NAD/FAD-dependent oxidoreductase
VRDVAAKRGLATLEAVLTGRRVEIPWRDLRDRERWLPGWIHDPARRALVVGAGLAGLACAEALQEAGWAVTCVDKGRGAGGRASTRRRDATRFDHGAQYVTASDPAFSAWLSRRVEAGALAPWTAPLVRLSPAGSAPLTPRDRFVGIPGMSALLKGEAEAQRVRFGLRVAALRRGPDGWQALTDEGDELGPFALVAVATPAPQAVALLSDAAPLADQVATVEVAPCWAVMASFAHPLDLGWGGAAIEHPDSPLSWVAHDGSKPGRGAASTYVLHGSPAWSAAHLEAEPGEVVEGLLSALGDLVGPLPEPTHATAHRWRYARTTRPLDVPCLWDSDLQIGYCGDACLGAKLESAFLSGRALAQRIGAPRALAQ